VRVNGRYLIGGIWWGGLLLASAVWLAWTAFHWLRGGETVRSAIGFCVASGLAACGVIMAYSIFSKD